MAFRCFTLNSVILFLSQVGGLFSYDTTKPNSHRGRLPGDLGPDSFMGHVQSYQWPGKDLLGLSLEAAELLGGLSAWLPVSPCQLPPEGQAEANPAASCLPLVEAGRPFQTAN